MFQPYCVLKNNIPIKYICRVFGHQQKYSWAWQQKDTIWSTRECQCREREPHRQRISTNCMHMSAFPVRRPINLRTMSSCLEQAQEAVQGSPPPLPVHASLPQQPCLVNRMEKAHHNPPALSDTILRHLIYLDPWSRVNIEA